MAATIKYLFVVRLLPGAGGVEAQILSPRLAIQQVLGCRVNHAPRASMGAVLCRLRHVLERDKLPGQWFVLAVMSDVHARSTTVEFLS